MLITNLLLLALLLGFIGMGLKDGFIHSLGRLVGAIVGFLAAREWSLALAKPLSLFLPNGWARLIAFLVIFFLITQLVGIGFKLIDGFYRILSVLPFLKSINSLLGALLGGLEGVILVGGALYLVTTFQLLPWLSERLQGSMVAEWVLKSFNLLFGMLL